MHIKISHIIIACCTLLSLITSCSEGGSNSSKVQIINGVSESNIVLVNSNNIYPTQYLAVTLTDVQPGLAYYLKYKSVKLGTTTFPLCTGSSESSTCTGTIGVNNLLVYESADTFFVTDNKSSSIPQKASSLIDPVNAGLINDQYSNSWYNFQCGLESIGAKPPAPKCLLNSNTNSMGGNSLNVADGCQPASNSIITQSVVAFYFPDKFSSGNYGLSCTGIPVGESWVLTAGHCLGSGGGFFAPANKLFVLAGKPNLPIQIAESNINDPNLGAIFIESEYILKVAGQNSYCDNGCQYYADFALLKVKNYTFSSIIPLVESTTAIVSGTQAWITGYGMHNADNITGVIRDGELNYRDEYYYGEADFGVLNSVGSLPDINQYSWKYDGNGDSGGPLFLYQNNQLYLLSTLTGGTYFDAANIDCKLPGTIVQNTSMPYWGDTIKAIMNGTLNPESYIVD